MKSVENGLLEELGILSPWMNAPGFLGYLPPSQIDLPVRLGTHLPPPLTLMHRAPTPRRTVIPFTGGFLLHSGEPNPGLAEALRLYSKRWERMELPLWLSLLAVNPSEALRISEIVDELEYLAAFQVCLPWEANIKERREILEALAGKKPFFVEIPLDQVRDEEFSMILESSALGIVLSPPRGTLRVNGAWISGRLYGPALFPQAARALERAVGLDIRVIAGCGASSVPEGESLLDLGAAAVQLDVVLWS